MRKIFLYIRANLKKSKGQAIAIGALVLIAAVLLNMWLILAMDYQTNFDRVHTNLNAEHVTYVMHGGEAVQKDLVNFVTQDQRTDQYCISEQRAMTTNIPFGDGEDTRFVVYIEQSAALKRSIGRAEIVIDSEYQSGIYLPLTYQSAAVTIGKPVELVIENKKVAYPLCGFFNSAMLGSSNCSIVEIILTDDAYQDFAAGNYAPTAQFLSVRLKNRQDNEAYASALNDAISALHPGVVGNSNFYDMVRSSRYISQTICSSIISAMAFLILLVTLIVLISDISNYIRENIKTLGALKAIGWRGYQLIGAMILQFGMIAGGTALLGAILSYAAFPLVNQMMIAQTGIPYQVHFLFLPTFITILIPTITISLAVWFACWKIKRIEPIVALRQTMNTRQVKHNVLPLTATKLPVNTQLGLKTALSNIKQNLTIFVTMVVLSLVVVFSGVIFKNIVMDNTSFINILVGETADAAITVDSAAETAFTNQMKQNAQVKNYYLYHNEKVRQDKTELIATVVDNFDVVKYRDVICDGRFPQNDQEVAVAIKYAQDQNIHIGDDLVLSANGVTQTYRVCGFTQVTNNLGKDCMLNRAGYNRLGELSYVTYYLDLNAGSDIDALIDQVRNDAAFDVYLSLNMRSLLDNASQMYTALMEAITIVMMIVGILIMAFVLYLLIRTLLSNKQKEYGVYKALGFTTGQLIRQTAISFLPIMTIATIVGLIIGCFAINPMMSLFLSGVGLVKCNFIVPVGLITILGIGLVGVAFGTTCLLSSKVKKITPHELLIGE